MQELDEITLARARRKESQAQARLVDHYARSVYALVGRMLVGRAHLVDDVAQESLLKVLRGLPDFEPTGPARLSTWILTIATRHCIDVLRREGRQGVQVEPQEVVDYRTPERALAVRELSARVQAAMAALPEDQRAVLVLRAYHELDYEEIGRVLQLPLGTVKSRLGRARMALQQALTEPGEQRMWGPR